MKTKQKLPKVGQFFTLTSAPEMLAVRIPDQKADRNPNGLFEFVPLDRMSRMKLREGEYFEYFDDGTDKVVPVKDKDIINFL